MNNPWVRILFIVFFMAGAGTFIHLRKDLEVPLARPFAEFPLAYNGWRTVDQTSFSDDILKILRPTEYLSRRYARNDGLVVDMYLSFFNGNPNGGRIHSPKNCLPGGGWTALSSENMVMNLGEDVNLVRAVFAFGDRRDVIYYWFAMQDQTISDEISLKLAEIKGSILHRRRDQSFIRITAQAQGTDVVPAQCEIEDFLRDFYPLIRDFLPR